MTQLDVPESTRYLVRVLGARLTAAAVGVSDGRQPGRWIRGEESVDELTACRLAALHGIVNDVTRTRTRSSRATAAWLQASNTRLGGASPLWVLASARTVAVAERQIRQAFANDEAEPPEA